RRRGRRSEALPCRRTVRREHGCPAVRKGLTVDGGNRLVMNPQSGTGGLVGGCQVVDLEPTALPAPARRAGKLDTGSGHVGFVPSDCAESSTGTTRRSRKSAGVHPSMRVGLPNFEGAFGQAERKVSD